MSGVVRTSVTFRVLAARESAHESGLTLHFFSPTASRLRSSF